MMDIHGLLTGVTLTTGSIVSSGTIGRLNAVVSLGTFLPFLLVLSWRFWRRKRKAAAPPHSESDSEEHSALKPAGLSYYQAISRGLFENSLDGIYLFSPEGELLQVNPAALAMVGYSWKEFHELTRFCPHAMMVSEQQQASADCFLAVLRGEALPLYERTLMTKEGRRVAVEVVPAAIRDINGKVLLVQYNLREITARKVAEAALAESRERVQAAEATLQRAERLKDEFLASLSHELRTPLSGILGLAEALQMQAFGELTGKQLKAVKNIESSGHHLLEMINTLLDLARIKADKLDLQFDLCRVEDLCQACLEAVREAALQKDQKLSFTMAPDSISMRADGRRLKQMVVNLLSNAVKFTPEGGELGLVVQSPAGEDYVVFQVWDKGIGIAPDQIGRLFEPFVQLDSGLTRQYSGAGLGLALVQGLAVLHGGRVSVESQLGEGSCFSIVLPL